MLQATNIIVLIASFVFDAGEIPNGEGKRSVRVFIRRGIHKYFEF